MITIEYSPKNAYDHYGIDHFITRSGIPFEKCTGNNSQISLRYGPIVTNEFRIKVTGNDIHDSVCGKLSSHNWKINLCENPANTGKGENVNAWFENQTGEKYPSVTRFSDRIEIGVDIFRETGNLLSGHLDRIWDGLDESTKNEIASCPIVDKLEDLLDKCILEGCDVMRIPLIRKSFWPDAKEFAVCLTHDVDEVKKTYQWLTRPARSILHGDFPGLKRQFLLFFNKLKGDEPYWTFRDIAEIEQRFNARSTFFFLKESGKPTIHSPSTWNLYGRNHSFTDPCFLEAVKVVALNGSEIGIHGSFYSYIKPGLIETETRELKEASGEEIYGIRQHHLNLSTPLTWRYQAAAGLIYDSSLGYKNRLGFRWGTTFPFFPFDGSKPLPIYELPLSIMDICLMGSKDPLDECFAIADEVELVHGVLTILWHPPVFNSLEFPGAKEIYSSLIERAQSRSGWVASGREIIEWQRKREKCEFSVRGENSQFFIEPCSADEDYFLTIHIPRNSHVELPLEKITILGKSGRVSDVDSSSIHFRVRTDENNREIAVICNDI
jgi:peptidoglycan/xylan/chitin deacetylase (PgdA/CDA1 family)